MHPAALPPALQGMKVLDFSMGVAGPHAGLLCARHGADVVKVEPPRGDWSRELGRQYGDMSAFAAVYNRGKRSVAIDMKDPQGLAAVRAMAVQADVLIEAFRPGVMARFGLDYGALARQNPRLVYLSVNGFGQTGPLVDAPATDVILQAFSGLMYSNRDDRDMPQRIDYVVIDVLTGLYGFQAVLAALLQRARHGGTGRHVECSMLKAAVAFQAGKIVEDKLEDGDRPLYVPLGVFATADGRISLSVRRDDHFVALCNALGRADLVSDGRYATGAMRVARAGELLPILRAEFEKLRTERLSEMLTAAGILHSRVNSYADLLAHEQVEATQAVHWAHQDGIGRLLPIADIPGTPDIAPGTQAPHIGQHTLEVLRDWGISQEVTDQTRGQQT